MQHLTMSALGAVLLATALSRAALPAALPERPACPLTAALTGQDEVPGPGDPRGSGTARLTFDLVRGEVCFDLTVAGIAPAVAARVHEGRAGHAGRGVITLMPPTGGSSSGCVSAARDDMSALLTAPERYYVAVRTADFPDGALRGQLSR
ncbi:CHRD domain-containing protein [Sorangium sp. So ce590]|uniref:CHRD domain-containing protein n=1 Tax=unclassified Sorangium TaxID=2621164 RepID=UPI003F5E659A